MRSHPILYAPFLLLAAAATAQGACAACGGDQSVTCQFHAELRKPMDEMGMFLAWAKAPCCSLTGVAPCKACLQGNALRNWMQKQRRAHEDHLGKAWYDASKTVMQARPIADVIKHLGGNLLTASTDHFFVVSNLQTQELTRSGVKRFAPELKQAAARFPGLIDPQKPKISDEQWTLLFLLRAEALHAAYWRMLGLDKAHPLVTKAPRIEAFVLQGAPSVEAFKAFHDGASRLQGQLERFVCPVTETSDFPGEELPTDRNAHTLLAHRVAACLTDRLVRYGNPKAMGKTPWFLDNGLGHVLEYETSGKVVFRGSRSEDAGKSSDWEAADWPQLMYRLVGRRKKDDSPAAPTFDQLAAIDSASATFEHHLAAWSLMNFLRLQPDGGGERLLEFLLAVRNKATPASALMQVYGIDGPGLTTAWHGWVRDNAKQLLPPTNSLKRAHAEQVMASYEAVVSAKRSPRTPEEEHAVRRLAAIGSLRWAEPRERAVEHLVEMLRSGDAFEAMQACDTLRCDEMKDPLVASLLWQALEVALEQPADDRTRIHFVRAVGTQRDCLKQLLPILHRFLAAPTSSAEVLAAAAHTLGELGDEASLPALEGATKHPNPLVRAEAASALAGLSRTSGLAKAIELIDDQSWHVRIASVEIFRKIGTPDCVPPLFNRLPRENGRLAEDITNILMAITKLAKPFATGEQWKQWWENGGKEAVEKDKGHAPAVAATATGIGNDAFPPIRSKRFLFLIDVSSSMAQSVFLHPKAGTTSANPDAVIEKTKIGFIIEKVTSLIRDPKEIPDDVLFDVALFARQPTFWKRELVPTLDPQNRESAARFLSSESRAQQATTDLQTALDKALQLARESLRNNQSYAALDTIYLVTDGTPTAGKRDPELLLNWFRNENRTHRIKIYVITVGATDTDLAFLTRLATENYGPKPVVVHRE